MAKGWQRDKDGRITFYFSEGGKQHKVPRKETRCYDEWPDEAITVERERWGLEQGRRIKVPHPQLDHAATIALVDAYCSYLSGRRKKAPRTVRQHRYNLLHHVLPFFVVKEAVENPMAWPPRSVRLLDYLEAAGLGHKTIRTCYVNLRGFWRWLTEEGRASGALTLRSPIASDDSTPLSFTVQPKDILDFTSKHPNLRLLALLGYFFSLRPQELVALRPCDFRAGTAAQELECAKAMKDAGLYSRFAVHIHRQRRGQEFPSPKAGSKGWVACFNEQAAREIVAELAKRPQNELLFGFHIDYFYKLWRQHGFPGVTIKDLRRASIYWLGHFTKLPFAALKNHARHVDPSTTALYLRRPEDDTPAWSGLDLDA